MRVILLSHGTALLAGSGAEGGAGAPEYYPDNHEE